MSANWVAISAGALDVRNLPFDNIDCLLLATRPSEPIGLKGDVAAMWRRIASRPVPDSALSTDQKTVVREFEEFGLASRDPHDPARTTSVPEPWLDSPLHELVYSLVATVAREAGVDVVFIKGPTLHRQGLRERKHSGDVDVWVAPGGVSTLRNELIRWGWSTAPTLMDGLPPSHSVTLRPQSWGCEIDLHYAFPGIATPGNEAFSVLRQLSEQLTFAGTSARVPVAQAHAVIHALHAVRPQPGRQVPHTLTSQAAESVRRAGPRAMSVAKQFRADAALSPLLAAEFHEEFTAPEYEVPLNWRWRTQPTRFRSYVMMLRLVPASKRASWLFRAV